MAAAGTGREVPSGDPSATPTGIDASDADTGGVYPPPPPQTPAPRAKPLDDLLEAARAALSAGPTQPEWTGTQSTVTSAPVVPGYEILELLGCGGMGVVYKARHLRLGRLVALKMIRARVSASSEIVERFRTEAQAIARLGHPNVIQVYEVGEVEGQPYLALEFAGSGSLARRLASGPLEPRPTAALIEALARGVHAAHQQGVIHRDLKPANVLLQKSETRNPKSEKDVSTSDFGFRISDFVPKITDFGLAKLIDADQAGQTQTGDIIGTPSYMAPEQASGTHKAMSPAIDTYALGAILYEMLTGRPPFRGATTLDTLDQVRTQEPVAPSQLQPRIPRDLETICLKCLHKDPARRYSSAEALAEDCAAFLRGDAIRARPLGSLYHLGKFVKRHRALVTIAVLVLVALAGGGWFWAVHAIQRERADVAEKEKARLLLDGYVQDARLADRKGQWREAVAGYNKALEVGHRDPVGLRLSKIRALLALGDFKNAQSELERLAREPDLGDKEGSVLLLQGDILLCRDDPSAEQLIQRALDKGLPLAEKAYAQALLAETTPEATDKLRQSLTLDPHQPRARALLELLLILLARLSEADIELTAHKDRFPEDLNRKKLRALLVALEGNRARANALLDEFQADLGKEDVAVFRALVTFLSELRNPDNPPHPQTGLAHLGRQLSALKQALARLGGDRAGAGDIISALHQTLFPNVPLPSRLRAGFLPVLGAWEDAVNAGQAAPRIPDQWTAELGRAVLIHPEGTVLYMWALTLFGGQRFVEAEKAALEAAEAPALVPVRRHALLIAAGSEVMRLTQERKQTLLDGGTSVVGLLGSTQGQGPLLAATAVVCVRTELPNHVLVRRAVKNLRAMRALGPIPAQQFQRVIAVELAILAQEYSLARQLLDDWEQQAPDDPVAWSFRAKTELRAGACGPALKAAEKVLKHNPSDPAMLRLRQDAIDMMKKQAQPFLEPGQKKEGP
jgi:serine/threonine protein kinase